MEIETVADVRALIEQRPTDAELYQRLGVLLRLSEEARGAFERSIELNPTDAFSHLYLGNWFYGHRMYAEALARFQHATELLPDQAVAYWCLGDVYLATYRSTLALQAYQTAVKIGPDDQQAQAKLAACRDRQLLRDAVFNDQAATTVLLAARWLETHPNDLGVIHDYASMLYQMTRYDEALRVYFDAIERFPDARWGLYNQIGHLYRYRGDFAEAEIWYKKAVDEDLDEATSYIFLGAVQARQGKLVLAEETHRRATQCPEGLVDEALQNLGLVLRGQGRLAEAAECFRKAIELDPEYNEAIEALQDVESALVLSKEEGPTGRSHLSYDI